MDRRMFITSTLGALGALLVPKVAEAENPSEFYSPTLSTDFLELPKDGRPVRYIAPLHPVKASWVNKNILAHAAPGTVLDGWHVILDESLIIPETGDRITILNSRFEGTGVKAALVLLGRNCTVTGNTFDQVGIQCGPEFTGYYSDGRGFGCYLQARAPWKPTN